MSKKDKIKFDIIVVIAIIFFAAAFIPKSLQEDTFYMIKVGEYICQNGMGVVAERIEPFAWHEGMIYTYPHWLLDIIFYLIYNVFQFTGIYVFTVIFGIIIYLLVYITNVKACKNRIISAIITLATIYLFRGYITARAQIVTYFCCILTILFIERFLENPKRRYMVGLVIVPIILANCHAALFPMYFVLYLPYIAAYIMSFLTREEILSKLLKFKNKRLTKLEKKGKIEKVEKIKTKIEKIQEKLETTKVENKTKTRKVIIERNENVKYLILLCIACIITGFITPLRDIPFTYTIKSLKGNTMNFISEHQAVALTKMPSLIVSFVVLAITLFSTKTKIKLQDLFMVIGMSILAIISYKQFPIFWIGVMCIINKLIFMMIDEKKLEKIKKIETKALSFMGMVYTIMIIIIIFLYNYKSISKQSYVNTNDYPVVAAEWMKNNIDMDKMYLFNDFNYGSYLLFKDIPVFIDGRADAYDPVFNGMNEDPFLDYMLTSSGQKWYGDTFKKYNITHIITTKDSLLDMLLQRNIVYKNIYNDGSFVIYER